MYPYQKPPRLKSQLQRGKRDFILIFVGEVLTLQLYDVILKIVPTSVGENSFLQLYDVILNVVSISKTAKTKVSATKGEKRLNFNFCRRGFNLAIIRCYIKACSNICNVGWNSFYLDLGQYRNQRPPKLKLRLQSGKRLMC